MGWWAIPIVTLVTFTLYGIDGIGTQLEDPFGYDRNDIKMDAIIEDSRQEIMVVLNEWKESMEGTGGGQGQSRRARREMFAVNDTVKFFSL
jgi:putative membrane protein